VSTEAGAPDHERAASRVDPVAITGHHSSVPVSRFTIAADGIELAAEGFGDPAATPVVLLHGGGQTRHSWRTTATRLQATGWYAVTVDLRGHGESGWSSDGDYGIDRFADDVLHVVDHLGKPPVLIGASLGGLASLAALGRVPELALGLVLVDSSPFYQPSGAAAIRQFMRSHSQRGFASLEAAADAVAEYLPHRRRPANHDGLRKNLRRVDGRYFWHWDPAFIPADEIVARNAAIDPVRLGAAACRLQVPTLLMRGGESDVLTEEDAAQFLRLVPHAEFATAADARHMVVGDDNGVFNQVVGDFLDRRVRPSQELLSRVA
jgi:pimeloyl-ACP methyl ester carboxylesterase